jgi:hypothetical protein
MAVLAIPIMPRLPSTSTVLPPIGTLLPPMTTLGVGTTGF